MDIDFIIKRLLKRKETYSRAKSGYKELARSGWFLSGLLGLSDYESVISSLENEKRREQLLIDIYESEINRLSSIISNAFPHRDKFIKECVLAHSNEMFYLSTIGFLSLSDGIFHEKLGWSVFQGSDYIKKWRKFCME